MASLSHTRRAPNSKIELKNFIFARAFLLGLLLPEGTSQCNIWNGSLAIAAYPSPLKPSIIQTRHHSNNIGLLRFDPLALKPISPKIQVFNPEGCSAHIFVPLRRVGYIVDPGTKFRSMALQDDLRCPRGEREFFRAFPGDSSWGGVKRLGKRDGTGPGWGKCMPHPHPLAWGGILR